MAARWVALVSCVFCSPLYAANWTVVPTLQLQEIYSDNIRLARPGAETAAFVSSVTPGLNVYRQSGRNTLNLNYQLQNLYNATGSNEVSSYNQLQFNANQTVLPNKFFVNASSSISQQNISNTRIATDNISGAGNRTNVSTFSLAPTWTPHFGNYARGTVGVNFNTVTTDNGASSGAAGISDSFSYGESIQMSSGTEFKRVGWNLSFNNTDNNRATGSDVAFQSSSLTVRTYLNRYFNVFVQGGNSNNSYQGVGTNTNGLFYTAGAQWLPSRFYSLESGYGNNAYVTLTLNPMRRLSWVTTFRDNGIGLNSGQTWQTALNYRTQRSTWSINHNNATTTAQALLLKPYLVTVDVNPDPSVSQLQQFTINLPTLTDQVIVTQTWSFSASFNTGKSNMSIGVFDQTRQYQGTGTKDDVKSINASWNWRLSPKTSAYLSPGWQQIDRGVPEKDNRYDVSIGLNRTLTQRVNSRLEFRHIDQSSALSSNNFEENRATASLFMRF
ncbi:MAG: TIGR03016 family PEP-CTERM system-associated outer membrane protein [Methylovulum sp.]|nr:TIGR03016 family PEP-CTERM system-associated outer membrane protein [Methylovulum sp.]